MVKIILWLALLVLPLNAYALDIMLAQVYTDGIDVRGWLMSEKLDGVRGYWDGQQMLSKNGNRLYLPAAFTRNLPPFPLEGELWGGRGTFEKTMSIVKKQQAHDGWLKLKFAIFDVPRTSGGFLQRLQRVTEWFEDHPSRFAFVIVQKPIRAVDELKDELKRVEALGGEGLIVRKPDALYTTGRSREILKVKSYLDTEAVVIAHIQGTGRNQGRMGSLLVELPDTTQFKIGTGFSDGQRDNPPPVGATITFKYYGLYTSGIPKFPSFLRIRPGY